MASFKIHGGHFKAGTGWVGSGTLSLPKGALSSERMPARNLVSLDVMTQESKKKLLGTLGGGTAGLVLLGPLGAIGGMLLGGNKTNVTFVGALRDGRTFVGSSDPRTFAELKGIASTSAAERSDVSVVVVDDPSTVEPPPGSPANKRPRGTLPIGATSGTMSQQLRSTFAALGWTVGEVPKRVGSRHAILHASSTEKSIAVAITDDTVNAYNLGLMAADMGRLDPDAIQIVVGKSLGGDARNAGRERGIAIGVHDDAAQLIEDAMTGRTAASQMARLLRR